MRASLHDLQRAEHVEQQRDPGTLRARYTPLDVNYFGSYRVTQAFLSLLIRSRGAIVNNVSLMALVPRRSLRPIFDGVENRGGRHLPRSDVSVRGRGLAQRRGQDVRAPEPGDDPSRTRRVMTDRATFQAEPVTPSPVRASRKAPDP
jgi:hypothetical protein